MLHRRSLLLPLSLMALVLWPGFRCSPAHLILSPATGTQLGADGEASVEVDFGEALPSSAVVRFLLFPEPNGGSVPPIDVTAAFLPAGASDFAGESGATGALSPSDGIAEGRNALVVEVDLEGDGGGRSASTLFSWLPGLEGLELERCDPLDPSECLYPFPSDHFTVEDATSDTGRRVNFARESMPQNTTAVRVDPTEWNRNDGFSPGPMILARIPGVDLEMTGAALISDLRASLDPSAPIVLVHAESGERQLVWAELDANANPISTQSTILRPGANLRSGERYIVAMRNIRDASGAPIEPAPAFRVYRDRIASFVAAVEARRPAMERVFSDLDRAGISRDDLYLAWDFTVASKRNLSERLLHIRDDAFAELGAASPSFQITSVSDQHDSKILRRVFGTYEVPLYITNDGLPGARLNYEVANPLDELPSRVADATYTANFLCVIPRSASADGSSADAPARISLYGHGLLGSHRETGASHVADMANNHNFIFCGTDAIGMAEDDADFDNPPPWVGRILADFSLFPTLPDRMHQGILNTLFLGRLMLHPDGLASDPLFRGSEDDSSFLDSSELFYDGNSQGGILGGAIAAVSQDLRRAVLGVPGMNYSTLLRRSVDFDQFLLLLSFTYVQSEHSLSIALIQMLWDRTDTNGHVRHITSDTYANTPAKKVLLHVAWGDHQVANVSAEVEARSLGAAIHLPALNDDRHWEDDPFFGIPEISYPHDGSAIVYWDSGNATPPNQNIAPRDNGPGLGPCAASRGGDPHECPRREPAARQQKSEFLKPDGVVISVCGEDVLGNPLPCLAP